MSSLKSIFDNLVPFFSRAPMGLAQLSAKSIWTDAQITSLIQLLVEKGVFDQEEYKKKVNQLAQDFEEQILNNRTEKLV